MFAGPVKHWLLNGRLGLQGLTAPPFSSKHSMAYKKNKCIFVSFFVMIWCCSIIISHGRYNVFHDYSSFCVFGVNCCVFIMCRTFIRVGAWDPDHCLAAGEQSSCCEWMNQIQSSRLILIITAVSVTLYCIQCHREWGLLMDRSKTIDALEMY